MCKPDLLFYFQNICKKIYKYDISDKNPSHFDKLFQQFKKMHLSLLDKDGFERLFQKLFAPNLDDNIKDFIAEMVISYTILQKNPSVDIKYEPDYIVNNNHHPPDLEIKLNGIVYFIQIKRMAKSQSFVDNCKEYDSNNLMVAFNDTKQIVSALNRATNFLPKKKTDVFIIIQLVSQNVPSGNIEFADALYGEEITTAHIFLESIRIINTRKPFNEEKCNDQGGFFYSEKGKYVDAYIKATETNGIFFPYDFEMFINDKKDSDKTPIYELLNINATYHADTYFDN